MSVLIADDELTAGNTQRVYVCVSACMYEHMSKTKQPRQQQIGKPLMVLHGHCPLCLQAT